MGILENLRVWGEWRHLVCFIVHSFLWVEGSWSVEFGEVNGAPERRKP